MRCHDQPISSFFPYGISFLPTRFATINPTALSPSAQPPAFRRVAILSPTDLLVDSSSILGIPKTIAAISNGSNSSSIDEHQQQRERKKLEIEVRIKDIRQVGVEAPYQHFASRRKSKFTTSWVLVCCGHSSPFPAAASASISRCCVLVAVEEELPDLLNRSCFGRPFITAKSDKQWFQLGMEEGLHYSLKCLTIQDKSGMVFFFWNRPSTQDQKICLDKSGPLNYEAKYKGATASSAPTLKEDTELLKDGFFTNHARVLVGSGLETYERGKTALQNWRHFGLNWAFVESTTQIQNGVRFCVCMKEFVPWLVMPLEVVYVTESRNKKKGIALYQFGSGTRGGHLLAGEERFSIELDENNQVWYEILSFSKPAHFLSFIGYPYVQLKQKLFANQSGNAMLNYLKAS